MRPGLKKRNARLAKIRREKANHSSEVSEEFKNGLAMGREERIMKVYELIQKLCENDPNHEVIIRVDGKCDRFMEYIEDSQNSAMEWAEIWATVDAVHAQKGIDKVFVDCDLSRL